MFEGTLLADFAELGSTGVSVFFVLSGFILTYTYSGRSASLGQFYWARIVRIWPIYLAFIIGSLPVYWGRLSTYLAESGDSALHVAIRFLTGT